MSCAAPLVVLFYQATRSWRPRNTPERLARTAAAPDAKSDTPTPLLVSALQELGHIKAALAAREQAMLRRQVQAFNPDHPHFAAVQPTMATLLATGPRREPAGCLRQGDLARSRGAPSGARRAGERAGGTGGAGNRAGAAGGIERHRRADGRDADAARGTGGGVRIIWMRAVPGSAGRAVEPGPCLVRLIAEGGEE